MGKSKLPKVTQKVRAGIKIQRAAALNHSATRPFLSLLHDVESITISFEKRIHTYVNNVFCMPTYKDKILKHTSQIEKNASIKNLWIKPYFQIRQKTGAIIRLIMYVHYNTYICFLPQLKVPCGCRANVNRNWRQKISTFPTKKRALNISID